MNAITKAKPKIERVRASRVLGYVRDSEAYFAKVKSDILDRLGDLSDVRVPFNRILVAVWATTDGYQTEGGIILQKPDQTHDENKWQGVSALVVKMGPQCYAENDQIKFLPEDRCQVGDWVLFRKGEGFRVEVWMQECVMLDNERAIKAVIPRPDMVY